MIFDYLEQAKIDEILPSNGSWRENQLGAKVDQECKGDLEDHGYKLAILGVGEDRSSTNNHGCGTGMNKIRQELYSLYLHFALPKTIDLGNIRLGHTLKDTQVALKTVVAELLDRRIVPIILGGGHDMTYGQFQAYENRIHDVDIVIVDEKIDLMESEEVNAASFLRHIIMHQPNFLFSASHLGHQLFYNDPRSIDVLETLNYDVLRLGEVKKDIFEMEPILRNADMLSFDLSALRSSDAPANALTSPNGLSGEEACQLCRFAGYSNKISSFGLYEFNPYFDQNNQGAKQASQMIWYFIEGFANRKENDYPSENNDQFIKYYVKLESSDYEIVFWKSNFSNKWWMEVPQKNIKHNKFIPCSYKDYENAMRDELPDKWMKVYAKLN
ncbi:MAG: formiminoglutamase [Chitinophagales bacterium]|jgi:formiminoglutamase